MPATAATVIAWQRIALPDADVRLATFCDPGEAAGWFARLHAEVAWEQHWLTLFGRRVAMPRLSCWVGDAEAAYRYSGTRFEPQAWTPALAALRDWLARHGETCNSVLCNLYRDGQDAMGWHADNETELGAEPVILSFSFGGVRRFRLRHRERADARTEIALASGSLLRMAGATQSHYRHDLPRTARPVPARINLTFRRILPRHGAAAP